MGSQSEVFAKRVHIACGVAPTGTTTLEERAPTAPLPLRSRYRADLCTHRQALHWRTASFDFAQDEVNHRWHIEFNLILSEVEGRTKPAPRPLLAYSQSIEIARSSKMRA